MDIITATRSYESWLARHTQVVRDDLRHKQTLIARSAFRFLRGTFYWWVQRWPEECRSLADAPTVLAVGDLHVENFGTWRDAEGRLVWGVNDLEEAAPLPYTSDLVRLATSAALAMEDRHIDLPVRGICDAILGGYAAALERGGRPVVLAERNGWLRQLAVRELKDPQKFWSAVAGNPEASTRSSSLMRLMALPAGAAGVRLLRRRAGVGGLGRRRFVALATYQGGFVGREAKALVPPATAWAAKSPAGRSYVGELDRLAIRARDPFFKADDRWTVRRLSPDCTKIEIEMFPRRQDHAKLLRAMGWETANMHLGTPRLRAAQDVAGRGRRWLERATLAMIDVLRDEYRAWKRQHDR